MSPPASRDMGEQHPKGMSPAAMKALTDMFETGLDSLGLVSGKVKGRARRPSRMPEAFSTLAALAPEIVAEELGLKEAGTIPASLRKLEPEKLDPKNGGFVLRGTITAKMPVPRSMIPEENPPKEMPEGPSPTIDQKFTMTLLGNGESPLEPRGQRVPVTYEGVCGRRHPGVNGGEGLTFTFAEWAPRMLCMPGYGHTPDTSENTCRFVASMAKRHIKDLLLMRPWDCQFCGDRATTFNLVAISFLAPDVGTIPPIRRSVWSYCVPICRTAGYCDQKGARLAGEFRRAHLSGSIITSSGCCMKCNKTSDITLCRGCKMVQYVKIPSAFVLLLPRTCFTGYLALLITSFTTIC